MDPKVAAKAAPSEVFPDPGGSKIHSTMQPATMADQNAPEVGDDPTSARRPAAVGLVTDQVGWYAPLGPSSLI